MSRRVNILAVLIVLGTSVPNVPIVFSEDDGAGSESSVPNIEIYPAAVTVVAGERFTFELLYAQHVNPDQIEWRAERGEISRGSFTAPDKAGVYRVTATYRTYEDPGHFHDTVEHGGCGVSEQEIRSMPPPGPEGTGYAEATVTVIPATFQIVPAWATAGTETTVFFDTTSNAGSNEDVRWELVEEESGGSLHVSGLVGAPKTAEYTTPPVAGIYHLRAIRTDRPEMKASVAVTVTTDPVGP